MNIYFDPYDIWSIPKIGQIKQLWSRGNRSVAMVLFPIGFMEYFAPILLRKALRIRGNRFAHVEYMLAFAHDFFDQSLITRLQQLRIDNTAWGLPFGWFSKNGSYGENTPYVTNTPYVMEALLTLAEKPNLYDQAMDMFHATWRFLEALKVMQESEEGIALSYAPMKEPRIVINANSYAALAYALHARHGRPEIRITAAKRAERLLHWVVTQQQEDGSWFYYADREPGNFIDCFHSCFVVKNLVKVGRLIPELAEFGRPAITRGWDYIQSDLYDEQQGLCRRFAKRAQHDPFRWDLYDQAEFLGLLVDFGELEWAEQFAQRVESRFRKGMHWYCRIDIFGRRWGRDFIRWGIAPFLYHRARLEKALRKEAI